MRIVATKINKTFVFYSFILVCCAFAFVGQVVSTEGFKKQIKERQDNFQILKDHMKPLASTIKSGGDLAEIQIRAKEMAEIFAKIPNLFSQGSGDGTDALPEIWESWDEFVQISRNAEVEARKMAELAETKAADYQTLFSVFQEIGKNCKACHQRFRN